MKFEVKVTREIDSQRVSDLFCGAFEGGSTEWLKSVEPMNYSPLDAATKGQFWYTIMSDDNPETHYFNSDNFGFKATLVEPSDLPSRFKDDKVYDRDDVKRALKVMANKSPRHFNNFIDENDDAETADVFMQYLVLGEVIYG